MLHYRARVVDQTPDGQSVDKLSTARLSTGTPAVDETEAHEPPTGTQAILMPARRAVVTSPADAAVHLGLIVPKRHAKRAVTRNLVRREARAQMTRCADRLPPGDWLLRLRAPFDRQTFSSAASAALLDVVRGEMSRLIADGMRAAAKLHAHARVHVPPEEAAREGAAP